MTKISLILAVSVMWILIALGGLLGMNQGDYWQIWVLVGIGIGISHLMYKTYEKHQEQ